MRRGSTNRGFLMPLIQCDDTSDGVDFKLGRAGTLIAFANCIEGQELRELVQNSIAPASVTPLYS